MREKLTPEEVALSEAAVAALKALEAERDRFLADIEARMRKVETNLPPGYKRRRGTSGPSPPEQSAEAYVLRKVEEDYEAGGGGLKPVEIAEMADREGFAPIATAPNPRLAVVAALKALTRDTAVYRAAYGMYRYGKRAMARKNK